MKKLFMIFVLALASYQMTSAQSAQSVYFELGGPGLHPSTMIPVLPVGKTVLEGVSASGAYTVDGEGIVFVPVGINYLLGKDSRHYFEVGGGATPVFGRQRWGRNLF